MQTSLAFSMLGIGALFAAATAPVLAAESGSEPKVYAGIVTIEPRDGEYDGYYCPPDPEEDDICLGSSILIQRGTIDRYVGARPHRRDQRIRWASRFDVDGRYVRLRMIGGHASRRIPAGRYLAVIEPTDKGYVYLQWRQKVAEDGRCFPPDLVKHYGDRLDLAGLKPASDGGRCL